MVNTCANDSVQSLTTGVIFTLKQKPTTEVIFMTHLNLSQLSPKNKLYLEMLIAILLIPAFVVSKGLSSYS
jgi:hypothetical protein